MMDRNGIIRDIIRGIIIQVISGTGGRGDGTGVGTIGDIGGAENGILINSFFVLPSGHDHILAD